MADIFINGWNYDQDSPDFARQVGLLMIGFFQSLLDEGLTEKTMDRHEENSWWIGKFLCDKYRQESFSFDMLYGSPRFVHEFANEVSDAPTRINAYRTTWRKLSRYAALVEKVPFEEF
jgi:hypothetical protein